MPCTCGCIYSSQAKTGKRGKEEKERLSSVEKKKRRKVSLRRMFGAVHRRRSLVQHKNRGSCSVRRPLPSTVTTFQRQNTVGEGADKLRRKSLVVLCFMASSLYSYCIPSHCVLLPRRLGRRLGLFSQFGPRKHSDQQASWSDTSIKVNYGRTTVLSLHSKLENDTVISRMKANDKKRPFNDF